MASEFPMQTAYGHDKSTVEEYTPGTAANAFVVGDFVILSGVEARVAGANPTAILGFSEVRSEDAKLLTANGKVPVRQITSEHVLQMCSDTTPVEATHLGQEYGITKDATTGNWKVDVSKTGGTARVYVDRLNIAEGIWFVKVLAEFIGTDGIDS
jgi:hypothetical protein